MVVLSLFDGISCGQVALERAGIKVSKYYASEIDKHAIKVTQHNYPDTIQLGDITKWKEWDIEQPDLIMGGSPCQDVSMLKKGNGIIGKKSRLFFDFFQILRHYNPKHFLLENVPMKHKDEKTITDLIGVEPITINSSKFCAAERERLYWTNINIGSFKNTCKDVLKDIMLSTDKIPDKYWYDYNLYDINMEKQVCAMMDFNNFEMHKRIMNPKFKCHTLTTCGGGNTQKKVLQNNKARKLMPIEYERLQTLPDYYTSCVADTHRYNTIGNGWTVDVIAHILKGIKE